MRARAAVVYPVSQVDPLSREVGSRRLQLQCAFHILTLEAAVNHLEIVTNSVLLGIFILFVIPGFSFSFHLSTVISYVA